MRLAYFGLWASVLAFSAAAQDIAPTSLANTVQLTRFNAATYPFPFIDILSEDGRRYLVRASAGSLEADNRYVWKKTGPTSGVLEFFSSAASAQEVLTFSSPVAATIVSGRLSGSAYYTPYPVHADAPLGNLSSRTTLPPGGMTTVGFVVAGGAPRQLLVRAIGPSLQQFGVTNPASSLTLTILRGTNAMATNGAWNGEARLSAAFTAVGAFGLPATSKDAALLLNLEAGAYTAQVRSDTGGEVLVEVYFVNYGL